MAEATEAGLATANQGSGVFRNTADAALRYLQDDAAGVLAVLTDLHMIGMDGTSLARRVSARWPAIPVVICTGGSGPGAEALHREPGVRGVLNKPIRLQQLNELFSSLPSSAAAKPEAS